jgi:hypothetical protein
MTQQVLWVAIIALQALLQYTVSSALTARQQQQQQQVVPALFEDRELLLHVDAAFDSEQVWLQLDLQMAPLRKRLRRLMSE